MDPTDLREHAARLEDLAHHTWPCLEDVRWGDWILRAAQGFTRRANSVLAAGPCPSEDLEGTLAAVRAWYQERSIEPCIKITPLAPVGLDDLLDDAGWAKITRTRVMGRELGVVANPGNTSSLFSQVVVDSRWLERHARWEGEAPSDTRSNAALLRRMERPLFFSWVVEGATLAVMVASLRGDAAHLYSLVVDPRHRGRGIGRAFVVAVLARLGELGLGEVVLQVLESNQVARALYASLGFSDLYGYHYRLTLRADTHP